MCYISYELHSLINSKESLLGRLFSYVYGAMDRTQVTLLALIDVNVVLDTVDHDISIHRLLVSFGILVRRLTGLALF